MAAVNVAVAVAAGSMLCPPARAVEVMLDATESGLTHGFGEQHSQGLRVSVLDEPRLGRFDLSLENKRAFGERAQISALAYASDLTTLDRMSVAVSGSNAPSIAAKWRVDGQYSRKLLQERNLVASIGAFAAATRDGHRDQSVIGSAAWYFADRQVAEAGVRYSASNPGDHRAWRGFAAYTYGAVGQSTLLLRAESGREAYQSLGTDGAVADFASQEVSVAYRHWLDPRLSLAAHAAYYHNPSYDKRSLGVSLFADF